MQTSVYLQQYINSAIWRKVTRNVEKKTLDHTDSFILYFCFCHKHNDLWDNLTLWPIPVNEYTDILSYKNTITLEYVTHFSAVCQSNAELQQWHKGKTDSQPLYAVSLCMLHWVWVAYRFGLLMRSTLVFLFLCFLFPETFRALISLAGGWLAKCCQSLALYDVTCARHLPIFLCRAATNYRAQSQ